MDVKYITPFMDSLTKVLTGIGISDISRGRILKKETMNVNMDITAVISLVGDIRGNVAYSLSTETARNILSKMVGDMGISSMDSLGRSAIGELANMITGTASTIFSGMKINVRPTPPSIIFGKDIYFIISSVQTIVVEMETPCGMIEVNIGLEI